MVRCSGVGRGAGKPCERSPAGDCVRCGVIPRVATLARCPDGGLLLPVGRAIAKRLDPLWQTCEA